MLIRQLIHDEHEEMVNSLASEYKYKNFRFTADNEVGNAVNRLMQRKALEPDSLLAKHLIEGEDYSR